MAAAAVAYGTLQIWTGLQQSEMMREQAQLNSELANYNAELAEVDSFNALKDGYNVVNRYQTQLQKILANQEVAFAANDVDSNFGTAATIKGESELAGFLNVVDLQAQARSSSQGFKRQASNIRLQGFLNQSASNANAAAVRGGALIRGAYSMAGNFKLGSSEAASDGGGAGGSANPSGGYGVAQYRYGGG